MGDRDGVEPDQAAPGGRDGLSSEPFAGLRATEGDELVFAVDSERQSTWLLSRDDDVAGALSAAPPSIAVAGEIWTGEIYRSGRGWWAEFVRDGTGETLSYRPRLLSGGRLDLGSTRYRLRTRLLGGWQLRDEFGGEIARIESIGRSVERARIELGQSAAREPRLATLLLATCLAIIWDSMTPHGGGGGS